MIHLKGKNGEKSGGQPKAVQNDGSAEGQAKKLAENFGKREEKPLPLEKKGKNMQEAGGKPPFLRPGGRRPQETPTPGAGQVPILCFIRWGSAAGGGGGGIFTEF